MVTTNFNAITLSWKVAGSHVNYREPETSQLQTRGSQKHKQQGRKIRPRGVLGQDLGLLVNGCSKQNPFTLRNYVFGVRMAPYLTLGLFWGILVLPRYP